jgi:hypothetical protein
MSAATEPGGRVVRSIVRPEIEGDQAVLLHLPFVIMATLSPIPVSDAVPQLDIVKECRFEGGESTTFDRCVHDETEAKQDLQATWTQASEADRTSCLAEATSAGFSSYIELLTCVEMARDLAAAKQRESGRTVGERER